MESTQQVWKFSLYIAGNSQRSATALANLNKYCKQFLEDHFNIEVIDLIKNPAFAERDQIVAMPTLIRKAPAPVKRIVGDLSSKERFIEVMNISTNESIDQ